MKAVTVKNEDWISCIGYNATNKRGYINNISTKYITETAYRIPEKV